MARSPKKGYRPSRKSREIHEKRNGFVPLSERPQLGKLHGKRQNGFTDPDAIAVKDLFPLLADYTNQQLGDALGVDESRIRHMRKQKHVSLSIADALLTFAGVSYLLGYQIKSVPTESRVPRRQGRWDATDSPSDGHA